MKIRFKIYRKSKQKERNVILLVSLTGALVEEHEIVRDGLFLLPKAQDRLDIYSVEGKSESTKSPSTQRCIFGE